MSRALAVDQERGRTLRMALAKQQSDVEIVRVRKLTLWSATTRHTLRHVVILILCQPHQSTLASVVGRRARAHTATDHADDSVTASPLVRICKFAELHPEKLDHHAVGGIIALRCFIFLCFIILHTLLVRSDSRQHGLITLDARQERRFRQRIGRVLVLVAGLLLFSPSLATGPFSSIGLIGDHSAVLEVHSKGRTRPSVVRSGLGSPRELFYRRL